jgi:hypothetical protein
VTAQAEFDQKYVSSTELCQTLGLSREGLRVARERCGWPEPVRVLRPDGGVLVHLWDRQRVWPHVEQLLVERQLRTNAA